jgi:hypothetical protein
MHISAYFWTLNPNIALLLKRRERLHLSVVGWPIDGAGDELQMETRRLLSEGYFSNFEHVHDINNPRPPSRAHACRTNAVSPFNPARKGSAVLVEWIKAEAFDRLVPSRILAHIGEMAKSADQISFDPKPLKAGHGWYILVGYPGGMQEHIPGFHSEAEAGEWLSGKGRQTWLRARGYAK